MEDNTNENVAAEKEPGKIKLTPSQIARKALWEFFDLLKGAAFPFIVMCVFSTTIILFFSYEEDVVVPIIATVFGEGLLIAAFIMFGKQNGAAAYRKTMINDGKRKLGTTDIKIQWRTGEYAPWKGFVIGFITSLLFLIFQTIYCFCESDIITVMLNYACGWAVAPLDLIGGGNIPQPYYLLMIVFPIAIHGGFYIFGRYSEEKRQQKISRAEDDKRKGKKKHYYEENRYERDSKRVVVDIPEERSKGRKRNRK